MLRLCAFTAEGSYSTWPIKNKYKLYIFFLKVISPCPTRALKIPSSWDIMTQTMEWSLVPISLHPIWPVRNGHAGLPISPHLSASLPISPHRSHYCLNHSPPWKNCLPWNRSLVPKRLGSAATWWGNVKCFKNRDLDIRLTPIWSPPLWLITSGEVGRLLNSSEFPLVKWTRGHLRHRV